MPAGIVFGRWEWGTGGGGVAPGKTAEHGGGRGEWLKLTVEREGESVRTRESA